jgi:uncharacterized protein (TIGR02594 family)
VNVTLFDIGSRFIGMRAVPGTQDNPQILAMLRLDEDWPSGDEIAWCSAWLNWCAWLLRLPRSKRLAARSWLDVGSAVPLVSARSAFDVVVLWREAENSVWGHVGLFAGIDDRHVYLLGGNQNNAVSVAPFKLTRVLGVRRLLEEP